MFYTSGTTGWPKGVRSTLTTTGGSPEVLTLIAHAMAPTLGIPVAEAAERVQLVCGPMYHSAQWVFAIAPLVAGTGALWIAAAMSEADREAAAQGVVDADDLRVRLLDIDPATFGAAYDVVCNATLWFAHHGLFESPRRPRFDRRWAAAWAAYRSVNATFADATAASAPEPLPCAGSVTRRARTARARRPPSCAAAPRPSARRP